MIGRITTTRTTINKCMTNVGCQRSRNALLHRSPTTTVSHITAPFVRFRSSLQSTHGNDYHNNDTSRTATTARSMSNNDANDSTDRLHVISQPEQQTDTVDLTGTEAKESNRTKMIFEVDPLVLHHKFQQFSAQYDNHTVKLTMIKLVQDKRTLELKFTVRGATATATGMSGGNNKEQQPTQEEGEIIFASSLPAELLRVESPSAEVSGHGHASVTKRLISGKKFVTITGIERVGNYAVRITFSDEHSTGIYTWGYLYAMCRLKYSLMKRYIHELRHARKNRYPMSYLKRMRAAAAATSEAQTSAATTTTTTNNSIASEQKPEQVG